MMATVIDLTELTDGSIVKGEWIGNGVFDKLMYAVNKNIGLQYDAGRINGNDFAVAYVAIMKDVLAQAKDYVMNVDNSQAQADLTIAQVQTLNAKTVAELRKQWGFGEATSEDGEFILGNNTGDGSIDKDIEVKERSTIIQETKLEDELLTADKQRNSIDKDIEVKERSTIIQETKLEDELLTSSKQRLSIDKEVELKSDELLINVIKKEQLTAQVREVIDSTVRANTQLEDTLLTSSKQRNSIDKDIEAKEKSIVIQETKLEDELLTANKQRISIDKDIEVKNESIKRSYVERIGADKDAAIKGLDNVLKNAEAERLENPDLIYTPKYIA